jgi:dihydroorotase
MSIRGMDAGARTAYVNARLMDPATGLDGPGGLLTEGEAIAEVRPGLFSDGVPEGIAVVDCQGLVLAPGLVDLRVQLREAGDEDRSTLAATGRAATAGGITSLVTLPNTSPVIDEVAVVEFVARRARLVGLAKVYAYGAVTKGLEGRELAEMGLMAEVGAVAFTDGNQAVADAQVMRRALAYAATFDLLIMQHPEEPSLAAGGAMNAGELASRLGLSGIPIAAEVIQIERDVRLVELTGGAVHFANVSTAVGFDAVRCAKARGLAVTCDTAPPYFALNEYEVGDYRTFAKLSPPLRAEADRLAVVEAIRDGTVDAIVSDHTPEDEDAKRLPFSEAAFGGVGLQTLLPVTLGLYHDGTISLMDALKLLTCKPADLIGLKAGRLQAGLPADFIVFDPDRAWKVNADALLSKSKNSPFDGRPVQGRVARTVIDGRAVFALDDEPGR